MLSIDLTGQKFGRLTAIKKVKKKPNQSQAQWLCKCDCGNEKVVGAQTLKSGNTRSCGCLKREKGMQKRAKPFQYRAENDYLVGKFTNGVEFKFDKEDLERIRKYRWQETGSAFITELGVNMVLSKFILGEFTGKKGAMIFFKNGDIYDYRKQNLTKYQSGQKAKAQISPATKERGIYLNKRTGIYTVRLKGKHIANTWSFEEALEIKKYAIEHNKVEV